MKQGLPDLQLRGGANGGMMTQNEAARTAVVASGARPVTRLRVRPTAAGSSQGGTAGGRLTGRRGPRGLAAVRVEPIGTHRSDTINIVDFKFDKTFMLFGGKRLGVQANLFNALNAATVVMVNDRAGPNYQRPTGNEPVLRPRVVTFDVSYRW